MFSDGSGVQVSDSKLWEVTTRQVQGNEKIIFQLLLIMVNERFEWK